MFEIIDSKNQATMSSREISELTDKRHDNVKRTIESMAHAGVISQPQIEDGEKSANGVIERIYLVNKRSSFIVVAQLSPEFTAKLVDRWQVLEANAKFNTPTLPNYQEALRQLADQIDLTCNQSLQLEAQKPAVEFVERYVESSGNKGFREVCKLLNANERHFQQFVLSEKIMYRLGGKLTAYGNHIDACRFEVNTGIADNEHAYTTSKFTPKGINWVAGLWAVYNLKG